MWLGLFFAISACFVWGMIFVIPEFLSDFSAVDLVLGRYISYGILSSAIFFRKGFSRLREIPLKAWMMGLTFALLSNIIYYFGIVAGVRFASAPLTVLIVGMAPITIALYGNWHAREIPFKSMIIPCLFMAAGLVMVNIAAVDWSFTDYSLQQYIIGVVGVLAALVSWSWYAVHNARFLKKNPQILPTEWATLIGVSSLFWVLILALAVGIGHGLDMNKFMHWTPQLSRFLVGIMVLGVICSWLGCFLWNRASVYLPVSLMGPFLIFESLFGLIFVYSLNFQIPSFLEIIGIVAMLGGILLSIYIFRKQKFVN